MKEFRWIKVIAVAIVIGLAIAVPMRCLSDHMQRTKNALAEEYANRMQQEFQKDPRFDKVDIHRFSAFGAIWIGGTVNSREDETALQKRVDETVPQLKVFWKVGVDTAPATTTRHSPVDDH